MDSRTPTLRRSLKPVLGLLGCIVAGLGPFTQACAGEVGLDGQCPRGAALQDVGGLTRVRTALARHEPVRVLALGSSSTEGAGASSPKRAYPVQLEDDLERLVRDADFDIVNAGKGGETAPQTLARLPALLAQGRFDLVIWQVGTNDAVGGADEHAFAAQLRAGIRLVRDAGADLVLMDQQYLDRPADPARYARFVELIAQEARAGHAPLFSRYALMRTWARQKLHKADDMLASDHFHMNDQGYACLAAGLAMSIAHQLQSTTSGAI